MVVGYHVWLKRAGQQPDFQGFESGIIVKTDAGLERRKGMFWIDDEKVVGGWCRVMLHNRAPVEVEVAFQEYVSRKGARERGAEPLLVRETGDDDSQGRAQHGVSSGVPVGDRWDV